MATARLRTERAAPAIRWDEPDCALCGGEQRRTILEAPDSLGEGLWFAIVQCRDCGLQFTSPRPDEGSIGRFYPPDYAPHHAHSKPAPAPRPWLARLRGRPCVERRTLPWHGQGRLLDFGCGSGSYLERMHRQGWHVVGIDTSSDTVETVRQRLDVPVFCGSLPHDELMPRSFDVVTMWQSLEHVHEPLAVLREARRLLAPGGKLIAAVPNIDSWPARWFGTSWYGIDLPRHLTHFSPVSLRAMLEAAGFANVTVRFVRHSDWLRTSAAISIRKPHTSRWHYWLTYKPISRAVAWWCYAMKQSDCILATANI